VIEYALLFALGFLTAVVIGLLVAPAIQRRIVRFAEDRLKATMPLSPQEVRAQRDAARATYAVENAKTLQALRRERDKAVALMVQHERTLRDTRHLVSENTELQAQLADMNVEAATMRSAIRQLEQRLESMEAAAKSSARENGANSETVRSLQSRIDKQSADLDGLKIDLAARDTEIEHLKSRMRAMHDERETLRANLKAETARAGEMELRLTGDEARMHQLENRLARETAANADRESALEQRAAEIAHLRSQVKTRGAKRSKHADGHDAATDGLDTTALSDDLRNRATALSERLVGSKSAAHDEALREEMAEIAAGMVTLTATREGDTSPIHGLLAGEDAEGQAGRRSLARRVKEMLEPE
jgi:chromosome segregation ATPase